MRWPWEPQQNTLKLEFVSQVGTESIRAAATLTGDLTPEKVERVWKMLRTIGEEDGR